MARQVMLAIDIVLGVLIGPPGAAADMIVAAVETGEVTPVILDLAIYCAMSSIRPEDTVDHARFARLLRHARFLPVAGRAPDMPLNPPSPSEIAQWRELALHGNFA